MMESDRTSADAARAADPKRPGLAPASGPLAFGWLLRMAALVAVAAAVAGVIVAPGVHGNAGEAVVVASDAAAATLGCFLFLLLVPVIVLGGIELLRTHGVSSWAKVVLVSGGATAIAMALPALRNRSLPPIPVWLSASTAITTLVGAYCAARAPHTRALAGVLALVAFAAIAHLAAWVLATRAGDAANVEMFAYGRDLATLGVLLEACAQLFAVMWLGTRGRWGGQLASSLALVGAYVLTRGVAGGMHSGAAPWQAMLHTALADAPGMPPPYGLEALATFVVPASVLLAIVAATLRGQVDAVVATMSFALVSRGTFDVPLCALCAVAAAGWAALASVDDRAMWRSLLGDRARRLREAGEANPHRAALAKNPSGP
jgi:hypothetical protein